MTKKADLQNKIRVYSTIALGVVGIGTSHSQIIYHDVIPDMVLNASNLTFNIDMDGNSVNDFQAQTNGTYRAQLNNLITADNGIAGTNNSCTNYYMAQAFAQPDLIGPALTDWNNSNRNILASYPVYSYGNFGDGQEHYAGVKFKIGANIHYGWIRFTGIDIFGQNITIKDWAYNSIPNQPINAGSGIVGIDNNYSSDNISLFCYNKIVNVNNLNVSEKGNIKITNIMGQETRTVDINDIKMTIDLNNVPAGIYIVSINNGKNHISRKINVK